MCPFLVPGWSLIKTFALIFLLSHISISLDVFLPLAFVLVTNNTPSLLSPSPPLPRHPHPPDLLVVDFFFFPSFLCVFAAFSSFSSISVCLCRVFVEAQRIFIHFLSKVSKFYQQFQQVRKIFNEMFSWLQYCFPVLSGEWYMFFSCLYWLC